VARADASRFNSKYFSKPSGLTADAAFVNRLPWDALFRFSVMGETLHVSSVQGT
jgi:hypothetical protein